MLGTLRDKEEQGLDWNVAVTYFHTLFRLVNTVSIFATEFYSSSLSSTAQAELFTRS
jgi:hypothetical protein